MVPSDTQGVGHFRSIWPAQAIEKHFNDEIEVEINHQPNVQNVEYFKSFDIIHFSQTLLVLMKVPQNFSQRYRKVELYW